MHRFWSWVIEPLLGVVTPGVVVEVGSEYGRTTRRLLQYAALHDAVVHSVDPEPRFDVDAWQAEFGPRFRLHRMQSLNALERIGPADLVLLDGDHNWYSVFHELKLLEVLARRAGRDLPLVLLHDTGWPYGRRDLYYHPEWVPEAHRQPYARKGLRLDSPELADEGGFNDHLSHALCENSLHNGVRTAAEDFCQAAREKLDLLCIPGFHGLGILVPKALRDQNADLAVWLDRLDATLVHGGYVEELERSRLEAQIAGQQRGHRLKQIEKCHHDDTARLEEKLEQQTARLAALERQLDDRRRELADETGRADALQEQLDERTALVRRQTARAAELERRLEAGQQRFAQRTRRLEEEARRVTGLHGQLQDREGQLQANREELESLQSRVEHSDAGRAAVERELTACRDRLTLGEAELEAARLQCDQLEALLRQRGQAIEALGRWLASAETAVAALLGTKRWRLGDRLVSAARRLLGRPAAVPAPVTVLRDTFARFHRHRQTQTTPPATPIEAGPAARLATGNDQSSPASADVVICVHNALEDVKACLASVEQHTASRHRIILVDDGSDAECAEFLRRWISSRQRSVLIRNDTATGYTRAANQGMRVARADYVVLLNSDAIVTRGWLERLMQCGESDAKVGIVGPLSNAASWQSVPERFGSDGDWAVNPLPTGWKPQQLADAVERVSLRQFPRVPIVNGFCMAVKKTVICAIGYLDEAAFPDGYGEENDYCLRAENAGFQSAIADHAYVYHAKSKSYSHDRRRELARKGGRALAKKHGSGRIKASVARLREEPALADLRQRLSDDLNQALREVPAEAAAEFSVLFVLPVRGGGGGAHSVVQEAQGMRALGVRVQVAIELRYRTDFQRNYPTVSVEEGLLFFYVDKDDLIERAGTFDVVVGTVFHSMEIVRQIVAAHPRVMPAYYVQDYEPRFFNRLTPNWKRSRDSYGLVPGAVLFAKTDWIRETVERRHHVKVEKVRPSLDHDVYYPEPNARTKSGPVRIAAMIRPSTPYRGAKRTMRVLARMKAELGDPVEIHVFGCSDDELRSHGLRIDFGFHNHGTLIREEVGELLRFCDVFVDFSDYQAFGRTGLEAMACGCAVVLPAEGGVREYAIDGVNARVVDTSSEAQCYAALKELVLDREMRRSLQTAAIERASEFSIRRAALSELEVLGRRWRQRRQTKKVRAPFFLKRLAKRTSTSD